MWALRGSNIVENGRGRLIKIFPAREIHSETACVHALLHGVLIC